MTKDDYTLPISIAVVSIVLGGVFVFWNDPIWSGFTDMIGALLLAGGGAVLGALLTEGLDQ